MRLSGTRTVTSIIEAIESTWRTLIWKAVNGCAKKNHITESGITIRYCLVQESAAQHESQHKTLSLIWLESRIKMENGEEEGEFTLQFLFFLWTLWLHECWCHGRYLAVACYLDMLAIGSPSKHIFAWMYLHVRYQQTSSLLPPIFYLILIRGACLHPTSLDIVTWILALCFPTSLLPASKPRISDCKKRKRSGSTSKNTNLVDVT